jgi:SAM-dependent methyltransferase
MPDSFQRFLDAHPRYRALYSGLARDTSPGRTGRLLATAAQLVHRIQGDALGPVADEILAFVDNSYAPGYVDRYIARVAGLAALQRAFDQKPSAETLGNPAARVSPDDYSLSLLLSIILTNHRFEIMNRLSDFADDLARASRSGRLASVGSGTGYELLLAARKLRGWELEAYEIDDGMRNRAKQLWSFFGVGAVRSVDNLFPLDGPDPAFVRRYDAIIMCELCEHLRDPLTALTTMRQYLKDDGRAFVTMAINIAQEDHIFLYPTIDACRSQLRESGLHALSEWIAPQTVFNIPTDREKDFKKGNYIAVAQKSAS